MANTINSLFTHEDDLYYFESDHLALKGNKDYCEVLKTIVILSALREKAIKDFNKVVEMRKEAIENPLHVLEKIQERVDLGVPPMVELPKVPVINFQKFDVQVPEEDLKVIYTDLSSSKLEEDFRNIKQSNVNNKAWTPEEQKKLEELLITYPPEPIEMRRFQKIAKALGNRTVQQVTSRVQKYFLKLYKAGLPIPGRIPKSSEKYKKSVLHKHQRHNHYLWKPTTFFPDLYVPVTMNDLDNTPGPSLNSCPPSSSTLGSFNYLLSTEYHKSDICPNKTEPEMQLDLLKRIRMEKLKEQEGNHSIFQHCGFRCDFCEAEPIIGPRWHCITCTDSVDYCTDCVLSQMYSDNPHPLHHTLIIHYNDIESHNSPHSDSDSYTESGTTKNYESDSNYSGEFESSNNYSQYETCDTSLDNVSDSNNMLDLDLGDISKNDDNANTSQMDINQSFDYE